MLFSYKAKNSEGELKEGVLEATSQLELARQLRNEGFYIIDIEEKESGAESSLKKLQHLDVGMILEKIKGVALEEKMIFSRNLAIMIESGISLSRSLEVLHKQTQSPTFRKAIQRIAADVKKGVSFSNSIKNYPKIFSPLYVSMVKVGESAGNLDETLNLLTEQLEKQHELKSKVRGALIYPAIIITAMTGVGILMMITVVPQLQETFEDLKIDLPITTRTVLGLSVFLQTSWWLILLSIPFIIWVLRAFFKTRTGHRVFSWMALNTPLFKNLVQKINSAAFARNLSSLITGGVPILEALEITSNTLGNYFYKDSIKKSQKKIQKGESIHTTLSTYGDLYTPLMIEMLEVGEESGKLSELLKKTAEFYEEEVADITANMSSIIEPVLMLIIGGIVGFFAVSIFQPIYGMLGSI